MEVRIYKPSKSATQSGLARTLHWVMEPETISRRSPEPLMGWTASADTLNQIRLRFDTAEEAVEYAKQRGWAYTVMPERGRKVTPRNYGDNFRIKSADD